MNAALSFYLGNVITSFIATSLLIVPFINALYRFKFQRRKQLTIDALGKRSPIFDKFHQHKAGTPVGGGALVIAVVTLMFLVILFLMNATGYSITPVYPLKPEIFVIFFTFLSFGALGLYDDMKKFFGFEKSKFFGLRLIHKFVLQWTLAFIIGFMLYFWLGISFLHVPFLGTLYMGWLYIPFAAFTIVSFANAVNITNGLDGLAEGVLMICLFGFWILSASILDAPLSIFISLWIGALIAFLYFNVYPARIWMGDVGALSFGASLAVSGLLLGKVVGLLVIGGIFFIEVFTSGVQLLSKAIRKRKAFPVAPFHLYLQYIGWEEPKIVARAWLAGLILTIVGLWISLL
jgi:phospho-N-acetylmuramoyl-pentapeptide-transferase